MNTDPFYDGHRDELLALVTDGSRTNRTEWARLDALIDPECVVYVGYLGDHVVHIRRANEGEPNFHLDFTGGQIRLVKLKYKRLQPPVLVAEADLIEFMDDYMAISDQRGVYRFFKYGARRNWLLNEKWWRWFSTWLEMDVRLAHRARGADIVDFTRLKESVQPQIIDGDVQFGPDDREWWFSVKVYERHTEVVEINGTRITPGIAAHAYDIHEFLVGTRTDIEVFFRDRVLRPPATRDNPWDEPLGSRNPRRAVEGDQRHENPGPDDVEIVRYRNPPWERMQRRATHCFTEPESRDPQNPNWPAPSGVGNPPGTAAALLLERLMDLQLT